MRMNLWNETKSVPISRHMVWVAYKKVKAKRGSGGVDEISMKEFDANRRKYLYKLWNRMASGSYFPPPVKEVEIPKKDGTIRRLGIPTISDRIGQMVVKMFIEPRLEQIFSHNSYGYRPKKSAHQALESVRKQCWKNDWVIDLDIKGFFDNIDHNKLMLAVKKHVRENWVKFYISRWLAMPVLKKSGELVESQGKGTPQGGVISPLLANLFLHYAFDRWLEKTDRTVCFTRYADDVIVHCRNKAYAFALLKAIKLRMESVGLELHPQKTKIIYCRDYRRQGDYPLNKFDFLGYSFQPRTTKVKSKGSLFLGFDCAISISSRKRIADKLEALNFERGSFKSIVGIAVFLNPKIRGWCNYYGKFRGSELNKVFKLLKYRIVRWARKKYKRYKTNLGKAFKWYRRILVQFPNLFYHWRFLKANVIA